MSCAGFLSPQIVKGSVGYLIYYVTHSILIYVLSPCLQLVAPVPLSGRVCAASRPPEKTGRSPGMAGAEPPRLGADPGGGKGRGVAPWWRWWNRLRINNSSSSNNNSSSLRSRQKGSSTPSRGGFSPHRFVQTLDLRPSYYSWGWCGWYTILTLENFKDSFARVVVIFVTLKYSGWEDQAHWRRRGRISKAITGLAAEKVGWLLSQLFRSKFRSCRCGSLFLLAAVGKRIPQPRLLQVWRRHNPRRERGWTQRDQEVEKIHKNIHIKNIRINRFFLCLPFSVTSGWPLSTRSHRRSSSSSSSCCWRRPPSPSPPRTLGPATVAAAATATTKLPPTKAIPSASAAAAIRMDRHSAPWQTTTATPSTRAASEPGTTTTSTTTATATTRCWWTYPVGWRRTPPQLRQLPCPPATATAPSSTRQPSCQLRQLPPWWAGPSWISPGGPRVWKGRWGWCAIRRIWDLWAISIF